jgi:hypothetical protein
MSKATGRPPSSSDSPDPGGLTKSEVFDLLRNQRRRFVLHYLKNNPDGEVTLGTLADQVAAWEYGVAPEDVSSTQRKRVYTTLQQSHLPKMDEAGILEFDQDRGTIAPTETVSEITIYMEVVPGREFAWHEYYLGLGAVCSALMVAVWAGIWPLTQARPIVWGTVVAAAIALSAVLHALSQRGQGIGNGSAPSELDFEQ